MAIHEEGSIPTYAPLLAQRRCLRERALTVFYRRHDDRPPAHLSDAEPLDSATASSRPLGRERGGLVQRLFGARFTANGHSLPPDAQPATPLGSAAVTAALVQRLTGPGSGPYSGTPFRPSADAAGGSEPTGAGAMSEAARHDHGIIDHSRHVSSIGRR